MAAPKTPISLLCILLGAWPGATAAEWHVGAGLGAQSFDTELEVVEGDVPLLFEPDDDAESLTLQIGYNLSADWLVTAEYSYVDADEVEIDNWYASINRQWRPAASWTVFLGALAGLSKLHWDKPPIDTLRRDRASDDFLWGAQLGASYQLTGNWRVQLRYQYLGTEHRTRLEPVSGTGDFKHEEFQNISLDILFRL